MDNELLKKLKKIKMLVLDVDGVMTDGGIIMDGGGGESKVFNVRDGHGLVLLQRHGISVAILTGRTSTVVEHRARDLKIKEVYQPLTDLEKEEMIEKKYGYHGIDLYRAKEGIRMILGHTKGRPNIPGRCRKQKFEQMNIFNQ